MTTMSQTPMKSSTLLEYLRRPLGKQIIHRETEEWSKAFWLQRRVVELGSSNIDNVRSKDDLFTMILPPPNITGSLHLGHALTASVQDAIVRHQLMSGKKVQWIPGFDHAGLSTQAMIEKQLWQDGRQTRYTIGREKFLKVANKWKDDRIEDIQAQLGRFGLLLNYEREYFTMDQRVSKAVIRAFMKLYQDKLLYREARPVHWSSFLQSTLSDIEVSRLNLEGRTLLNVPGYTSKIELGLIYKFAFKILDSTSASPTSEEIVVATTRIETMIGDVAVAVNPNDTRYQKYIGKMCLHPLTDLELPIVADEAVAINEGTGALKITPFLDDVDWAIAKRHNLPVEKTIDESGRLICPKLPKFHGMKQYEARAHIIQALDELGLFRGSEDYKTSIPLCSRTGDIIEKRPLIQWFINCKKLAMDADRVVKNGQIDLQPENYRSSLSSWLVDNGVKDWCISRQSWWGHRIPAYKYLKDSDETNNWVAAYNLDEARGLLASKNNCGDKNLEIHQDNDILDTWFSSSLLPFSVYDWPDNMFECNRTKGLFPLTLMETGFDILNYWVSRMIMLSLHLTGEVPFKKVLLHGMVCDDKGKKMSKSVGNVIDPLDIIDGTHKSQSRSKIESKDFPESGPDVMRAYLLSCRVQKEIISFQVENLIGLRKFTNKIWNIYRFILPIIVSNRHLNISMNYNLDNLATCQLSELDIEILSRMANCIRLCELSFVNDKLYIGYNAIYEFWVKDFCNNYVQNTKRLVRASSGETSTISEEDCFRTLQIQVKCLDTVTRLLHPYMPHLTELVYQKLRVSCLGEGVNEQNIDELTSSICLAKYPTSREWEYFYATYKEHFSNDKDDDDDTI